MTYQISPELKPLSANLKRLEIGFYFFQREFNFCLEENNLDDFWNHCKKEKNQSKRIISTEINFEENTEIFIIGLDLLFRKYNYTLNPADKLNFNVFFLKCFIFYLEEVKIEKDYSRVIQNLVDLTIMDDDRILYISNFISSKTYQKATTKIIENPKNNISNNKKYQVFISSTYIDLIEERQAAVEEILKKGHIPAGMELFSANNKSQWEVIKKWIDDSDIYVLLLGGRYGSIDKKSGLSYTEMEYNYAIEKNKPFFALILDDEILLKKPESIINQYELTNPKYISFKEKVKLKMSSFPKNNDQIKNHINHSLDNLITENKDKMTGWIKGN